jgi:CRP-like cAMP-binding protein
MLSEKIDIPGQLSRLPLFATIGDEAIGHLAAATREKRLARGEVLFQRGDMPRGFHVVVQGQVKLAVSSAQGNEKVVEIVGPQQSFGEAVMFMERPYLVFAQALMDNTLLLAIAKSAVFELLENDRQFARRMLAGLSMRLHGLVRDVESYTLHSSTQRLIGYLLQHCESFDDEPNSERTIVLPTSKQVIASRLNLTPETLSRIFAELSQAGLIAVQGKQITIHDPVRLSRYEP